MPNPSELERMRQENKDEMQRVSGTLNRDAFAYHVLNAQIKEQFGIAKRKEAHASQLRDELARAEADQRTAHERIASLQDTLSRMEEPRG